MKLLLALAGLALALTACSKKEQPAAPKTDEKAPVVAAKADAAPAPVVDAAPVAPVVDAAAPAAPAAGELPAPESVDLSAKGLPLTIQAPTGCTLMEDLGGARLELGDGTAFGLLVHKVGEGDTIASLKDGLVKFKAPDQVINFTTEDETTLVWKNTIGGKDIFSFRKDVKVGDVAYKCASGLAGGYTEDQVKKQMEICATLAAKP